MTHIRFFKTLLCRPLPHIVFLIILIISTTSLANQNQSSQDRTLLIGINKDFAPFEFTNEKGVPDGFTIDLMKAVARAEGLNIKFIPDTWSNTRRELENRKIDAVTGMMYSKERDKIFDFSIPNISIPYIIIKRKDSPIKSLDDVKEKEIMTV